MNRSKLVGGIICLVIAAVLLVAYFRLPEDSLMFMVGDQNLSWLPSVILGVVGIILVATAWQGVEEPKPAPLTPEQEEERQAKIEQNKRLESIGWGFFLVMMGGSIIVPDEIAPEGLWTVGVGLIMLGLNAARYYYGIHMSGFTTVLGLIAVAVCRCVRTTAATVVGSFGDAVANASPRLGPAVCPSSPPTSSDTTLIPWGMHNSPNRTVCRCAGASAPIGRNLARRS